MSYPDPITVESDELLLEHSNAMHRWLLTIAKIYSLSFTAFSIYLGDLHHALITATAFPLALLCSYLFDKGFDIISKFANLLQLVIVITMLCLLTGNNSFAFMFYFPIIISSLVIFQGKQKKWGYLIVAISVALLFIVTSLNLRLEGINNDLGHQKADQLSNIIGVCSACIFLFAFSIKSTDIIQRRLIEKTREVQLKNEQLAASVYTRDKMMSVLSHDLRSPVIALNSAMNVFTEQEIDPNVQRSIIADIKIKSARLLSLIDDLLDWSRTQSMALKANNEAISVLHFKTYISNLLGLIGEQKGIIAEINFDDFESRVLCDRNMIETVFRNLISNSIKFSEQVSKLIINATIDNGFCEFSIIDFGKGLTEKQINAIKNGNSFTTLGTSQEKGHGLGLQLVQEFLRKSHSELKIESTQGQGSKFYFQIALAP